MDKKQQNAQANRLKKMKQAKTLLYAARAQGTEALITTILLGNKYVRAVLRSDNPDRFGLTPDEESGLSVVQQVLASSEASEDWMRSLRVGTTTVRDMMRAIAIGQRFDAEFRAIIAAQQERA